MLTIKPEYIVVYKKTDNKLTITPKYYAIYVPVTAPPVEEDTTVADTSARVVNTSAGASDTVASVEAVSVIYADSFLSIAGVQTLQDTSAADTARRMDATALIYADTFRQVAGSAVKSDITYADTDRSVSSAQEVWAADTCLYMAVPAWIHGDTEKSIAFSSTSVADTAVTIPFRSSKLTPVSIELNITKGTLSDVFSMLVPYDLPLESVIKGKILDFPYDFRAYETERTGLMEKVTGMYDIDQLIYTPFNYVIQEEDRDEDGLASAKFHAENIAKMLNRKLYYYCDDFTPSTDYSGIGATIQNMVAGIWGWAGRLPQLWINVFLRNDSLYIVQRGQEPNTIDISNTKHSRPTISKTLMRSVWTGTITYDNAGNIRTNDRTGHDARSEITAVPFTGKVNFGLASCDYVNGLLREQVTDIGSGNTEKTSYTYDEDDYIIKKISIVNGETTETAYSYANTGNDKYLATESSATRGSDGSTTDTTITQHVYLGNGWYGTTVYKDGVYMGSSVSQGRPGAKASRYMIDQSNLSLSGQYEERGRNEGSTYGGTYEAEALFDTSFPVEDVETLDKLTKAIEWLNRKTEERVTMDIWKYPHVIDFTEKIVFDGNIYYLESNKVLRSYNETKQTVTLVRWY